MTGRKSPFTVAGAFTVAGVAGAGLTGFPEIGVVCTEISGHSRTRDKRDDQNLIEILAVNANMRNETERKDQS